MTIQEVERQSGMTRANIRFYEEKGLLTPQRQPNGYRDYSAADVETLRRVRLLRSLDISIDTIRALQSGERTLEAVLSVSGAGTTPRAAPGMQRRCASACGRMARSMLPWMRKSIFTRSQRHSGCIILPGRRISAPMPLRRGAGCLHITWIVNCASCFCMPCWSWAFM